MIALLLEQLSATRAQLLKEITIYNNTQFNQKPDENSWSIAQICHHLVLVEASTIKAITWGLSSQENSEPKRLNVQLIKDRTRKLKAPKIVEPSDEPFEIQQILTLLDDTREQFTTYLQAIEDPSLLAKKPFNILLLVNYHSTNGLSRCICMNNDILNKSMKGKVL